MNSKRIIILGAGGFAKTLADILQQNNTYTEIKFLDDTKTGANILGKCNDYSKFKNENTCNNFFTHCLNNNCRNYSFNHFRVKNKRQRK